MYRQLGKYNLPSPESIFDIDYFKKNPSPFYRLAKELYPGRHKPTLTHHFICLLHEKNILTRAWTQNIDGLERIAGLPANRLVEAHGTFASARCVECKRTANADQLKQQILRGCYSKDRWPRCQRCNRGLIKVRRTACFFLHTLYFWRDCKCNIYAPWLFSARNCVLWRGGEA